MCFCSVSGTGALVDAVGCLKGLTALSVSCADGTRPRYIIYSPGCWALCVAREVSVPAADGCSCFRVSSSLCRPEQQRCSIKGGDKNPSVTLKPGLLPLSVDCLCETFLPWFCKICANVCFRWWNVYSMNFWGITAHCCFSKMLRCVQKAEEIVRILMI